jgi:hypothetical protein
VGTRPSGSQPHFAESGRRGGRHHQVSAPSRRDGVHGCSGVARIPRFSARQPQQPLTAKTSTRRPEGNNYLKSVLAGLSLASHLASLRSGMSAKSFSLSVHNMTPLTRAWAAIATSSSRPLGLLSLLEDTTGHARLIHSEGQRLTCGEHGFLTGELVGMPGSAEPLIKHKGGRRTRSGYRSAPTCRR